MKLIKIGRATENDIIIDDDSNVSRNHAEIFADDQGRVFLTDLDSSNGTFVNGNQVNGSVLLKKRDVVKIGNTVLPWRNFLSQEPVAANKEDCIKITEEKLPSNNDINNQPTKISYYFIVYSIIFLTGFIYVANTYGIKDFYFLFDVIGVLFIPALIGFGISLITKYKFYITFCLSAFVVLILSGIAQIFI